MPRTSSWLRVALGLVLAAPVALNGCSFITLGAAAAIGLASGGGGGDHSPPPVSGPPWHTLAPLSTARWYHSATVVPQGEVLVAGGQNTSGTRLSSAQFYDFERAKWFSTGGMTVARSHHSATVMEDGRVLVVGGYDGTGAVTNSAEIYDALNFTWTTAASANGAAVGHTATALTNGLVLVTNTGASGASELYDLWLDAWSTTTGGMVSRRNEAAAALLQDGRVLVCGGDPTSGNTLATAEIYDPTADTWSAVASMNVARKQHTATTLHDGRVLVAGGFDSALAPSGVLNSAEIYDPSTNAWSLVPNLASQRAFHTATLLPDTTVLVVGGSGISGDPGRPANFFAERYDLNANGWLEAGSLVTPRFEGHRTVLLQNGNVMVIGGLDVQGGTPVGAVEAPLGPPAQIQNTVAALSPRSAHRAIAVGELNKILLTGGWNGTSMQASCELIDPVAGTRVSTGAMNTARNRHVLVGLPDGTILACGGWTGTAVTASAELYVPSAGTWNTFPTVMGTARNEHCAVVQSGNGRPLIAGGDNGSGPIASVEEYDFVLGNFMGLPSMGTARKFFTLSALVTGKVLACGGWDGTNILQSCELWDPATTTWAAAAQLPVVRDRHTATTLPSGKLLVTGGWDGNSTYSSAVIYDPTFDTWSTAAPMPTARRDHMAAQMPDGKVLVYGGIDGAGNVIGAPVLYDAETNTWRGLPPGAIGPTARVEHQLTVHNRGVFVSGGETSSTNQLSSTQWIVDGRPQLSGRPVITAVGGISVQPYVLTYASTETVSGNFLRGVSDGAGGGTGASASDTPVVTLTGPLGGASGRSSSGDPQVWRFDTQWFAAGTSVDFLTPNTPTTSSGIRRGVYALRVIANGMVSDPFFVRLP